MATPVRSVVAIEWQALRFAALNVSIHNEDVYVNYYDRGGQVRAHTSYHASGQHHIKVNGKYVRWTDGSGGFRPMKLRKVPPASLSEREEVSGIGWAVGDIQFALPELSTDAALVVHASNYREPSVVLLVTSILGSKDELRSAYLDHYPVVGRYRLRTAGVFVEIEAVLVESGPDDSVEF
jgi:hypothetical protein